MKIYVDFDRTLFDCDKFLEDFYALIEKYKIPKDLFRECQSQCKRKGFNPYTILSLVKEKFEFDGKIEQDISALISKTSDYLYSDAIVFLKYLKKQNYEIIIFTKGNSTYQREKIFNAHIDKYYDSVIVTMHHKGSLNIDYKNSIFIDDNLVEIGSILKKEPLKMICITHGKDKYKDVIFNEKIIVCETLNDIIENGFV